jgi:hypothetical protein
MSGQAQVNHDVMLRAHSKLLIVSLNGLLHTKSLVRGLWQLKVTANHLRPRGVGH